MMYILCFHSFFPPFADFGFRTVKHEYTGQGHIALLSHSFTFNDAVSFFLHLFQMNISVLNA